MKLVELFLNETTEEDRAIISLAEVIYRHVIKYRDYIDDETVEPIDLGKIGDFADTPLDGFGDIKIELKDGEQMGKELASSNNVEYEGKDPSAEWNNAVPVITLNWDRIHSESAKSSIVHELRHALDDLKSSGKANIEDRRYRTPKKKEHRKKDPYTKDYPYLAQPAEINARFAQVMDGVIDAISKQPNLPPKELTDHAHKALKRLFIKYSIADIFPEKYASKDYKRLVKRAVDMIQKEVNYIEGL